MERFTDRIAVVTGGGTGMGRELVRQLAAEGCHVATCDVNPANLAEAAELATAGAPSGTRVTTFVADVSAEDQMRAFGDHVRTEHSTDAVHLVFNNAGIGGGGSFVAGDRAGWDRTFEVCWRGVYNGCRVFLPLLIAADEGHVVNTASVNGLWASIGPASPHTAYSAAKFAVRGFTEALITDLRVNAPHVRAHLVMPGHIGTSIVLNSMEAGMLDPEMAGMFQAFGEKFRDDAPTTAAQAATIILDGVRAGRWRILVGDDAGILDEMVRADPERVYEPEFYAEMASRGGLSFPT